MPVTAHIDDFRSRRSQDIIHDEIREQEWSQMVNSPLFLVSFRADRAVARHDTSIVHQYIDSRDLFLRPPQRRRRER